MNGTTQNLPPLIFTEAAAAKVYSLLAEEDNFNLNLRVYITGGGCSGFQYGFTFDEKVAADDIVVVKQVPASDDAAQLHAVQLLVDPLSFQYLKEATIDYKQDVSGEHFVINNPNAKTTCGCGASFAA